MLFEVKARRVFLIAQCMALTIAGVLVSSCDTAPGPSNPTGRPPALSNFTYSPQSLNLLESPDGAVVDGRVNVDFQVQVSVSDDDSPIDRVLFVLEPPTAGRQPLVSSLLDGSSDGTYTLERQVSLSIGETGNYSLSVHAVDDTGLLSNRVLGTFSLVNEGEPPVVDSLDVPDVIQRPASGTQSVVFAAWVSDPDGLPNIASVVFWNVSNPGATISLFDDGESGGDDTAGDGRYTATVQISSSNSPGVNRFAFQATDRAGLKSNVVEKDVTIE